MENNFPNSPENNGGTSAETENAAVSAESADKTDVSYENSENAEAVSGRLDDSNLSDDFVIGQDFFIDSTEADLMADDEETKHEKKKNKKKTTAGKSCLTSMIWMAAIFFIAIGAAAFMLYLGTDYLGVSLSSDSAEDKVIVVEQGTSAKEVAEKLEEAGVIKSSLFFRLYAKKGGYDSKFQYGVYYFCKQDSYEDIAEALTKKGAVADEVKITIPEGSTIDDIAKKLEEGGVCTAEQFKLAVNEATKQKYDFEFMSGMATQTEGVHYRLEGYLFPDTYFFYATGDKSGAEQAIRKMLEEMDKKLTENGLYDRANETGRTVHDVLTMASVIELEASATDYTDKQKVSAVFWNRIDDWGNGAYLQSDPTKKYPYNTERYDTYKSVGLAPGAYCSPSLDSIKAALYPDEACTAYFFVTDKDMNFYFNNTNEEHNSTILKLKRQGLWAS